MSDVATGLIGFIALFVLMIARIPVGLAMLVVGAIGSASILGAGAVLSGLKTAPYEHFASYSLSIIPLFLLMGQLATRAGISTSLFAAARSFLGHRRGGLAISTIGACGAFGAVCGSSLATAATMAQVALPEMKREGYHGGLATGVLAAGGTLGILIPPSIVLVVYAIIAEQNIAKLFVAALVPGVLAVLSYMVAIAIFARVSPESAPVSRRATGRERLNALLSVWPVVLIFILVLGGMYAGVFTPTEAAAVGMAGTGLLAITRGNIRFSVLKETVFETAVATGMIFFIVLGAALFNSFLALSGLPQFAAEWVGGLNISPWLVLVAILLCYVVLGCVMESLSMILLTTPIFLPIILGMDFGLPAHEVALWFGVLALVVVEVGMITPPVGLNLFVINSMAPDVSMMDTIRGVIPLIAADLFRILILVMFPLITLGLVRLVF